MSSSENATIEKQWDGLVQQLYGGMPKVDFLVGVEGLLDQLDPADPLAYAMRLHAIYPRTSLDPIAALDEFEALLSMHESNPQAYAAHPFEQEGNWFETIAEYLVWWLAQKSGREAVERLMMLAPRVFHDPEGLRHLQIIAYTTLGEGEKVIPLLRGYLPPVEAYANQQISADDWLERYDMAAMAYLQQDMLEECNTTVDQMLRSGIAHDTQPLVMVAESLLPLAEHIPLETSVDRKAASHPQKKPRRQFRRRRFCCSAGLFRRRLILCTSRSRSLHSQKTQLRLCTVSSALLRKTATATRRRYAIARRVGRWNWEFRPPHW